MVQSEEIMSAAFYERENIQLMMEFRSCIESVLAQLKPLPKLKPCDDEVHTVDINELEYDKLNIYKRCTVNPLSDEVLVPETTGKILEKVMTAKKKRVKKVQKAHQT